MDLKWRETKGELCPLRSLCIDRYARFVIFNYWSLISDYQSAIFNQPLAVHHRGPLAACPDGPARLAEFLRRHTSPARPPSGLSVSPDTFPTITSLIELKRRKRVLESPLRISKWGFFRLIQLRRTQTKYGKSKLSPMIHKTKTIRNLELLQTDRLLIKANSRFIYPLKSLLPPPTHIPYGLLSVCDRRVLT